MDRPTTLQLLVGDVSGWGGANLKVRLDGEEILTKEFADPDDREKTDTLTGYAGILPVEIPAGHHTVEVDNTGHDWVGLGYRFKGTLGSPAPPLDAYAILGKTKAIVWLQVKGRSWRNVVELKQIPSPVPPTKIRVPNLPEGTWQAEVWDTWTGKVLARKSIGSNGSMELPAIETDLAIKFTKK